MGRQSIPFWSEPRALQALARYHLVRCATALGQKHAVWRDEEESLQEPEALGHLRAQEARE